MCGEELNLRKKAYANKHIYIIKEAQKNDDDAKHLRGTIVEVDL